MARRDIHDDELGLPIKLRPVSNGEFYPPETTPLLRRVARQARIAIDANARRAGVGRRQFLLSAAGSATVLSVLAACSKDDDTKSGSATGGTYSVSEESTVDSAAAATELGGDEFIFDVQGHLLEYPPEGKDWPVPQFAQASCGAANPHDCFDRASFLDLMFAQSDTRALVLSGIPGGEALFSSDTMKSVIADADELRDSGRVFMQPHLNAGVIGPDKLPDAMAALAENYPMIAWKTYTHAGGPGWYFDDHDSSAPQVGRTFVRNALALGKPIIAVHKGLNSVGGNPANAPYSDPVDIGPIAAEFPDARFVVYHSGYDFVNGFKEGPFDENATEHFSVDRLVASVRTAGIKPGGNVYAELGRTWRFVMAKPTEAAHTLGKLLLTFGEDNVVWGTDSIWYGSPQDQIEAFRAFEITVEFQEKYGYPALTRELKAKIFGLNSARLYDIDPVTVPCALTSEEAQALRQRAGTKNETLGPTDRAAIDALAAAH